MSRLSLGLLALCCATGVVACDTAEDGDGMAPALENQRFVSCAEDAGATVDESDQWSQEDTRAFLARPESLHCAAQHLEEDQLESALQGSFSEASEQEVEEMLVAYVRHHAPASALVAARDVGILLGDLEHDQEASRRFDDVLAWTAYAEAEGTPESFDAWRERNSGESQDEIVEGYIDQASEAPAGSGDRAVAAAFSEVRSALMSGRQEREG